MLRNSSLAGPGVVAALVLGSQASATRLAAQSAPVAPRLCRTAAAIYKGSFTVDPRAPSSKSFYPQSPLTALAAKAGSGIRIAPHIAETGKDNAPRHWERNQNPPFSMPPALRDAIGKSDFIDRLPNTGFYAASSIEGTAHCYDSTYYEVKQGRVELAAGPGNWNDDDGAGCGVSRAFGTIGAMPVAFEEDYDYSPSMTSSLSISGWTNGRFGPSCTISFRFAPRFAAQGTYNAWQQSCAAANCDALRNAALGLVETVQAGPRDAVTGLLNKLTPAQKAAFLRMASDAHIKPPETSVADTAELTDTAPLALPLVVDNRLYLALAGHFTIGWRTFSDWSVKIDQRKGKELGEVAAFAIGMTKGRLKSADVK